MKIVDCYNDPQIMQHAHFSVIQLSPCSYARCVNVHATYFRLFVSFWRTKHLNRRPGASHLYSVATDNWLKKQKKTLPLPRDESVGSSAISAWSFIVQCYPVTYTHTSKYCSNLKYIKCYH